jgi:hypothetical protein
LDIFLRLGLKSPTTFRKLALLPSSGEELNRLGPLEKANFSTLDPTDWGFHLMLEAEPASDTLWGFSNQGEGKCPRVRVSLMTHLRQNTLD